MPNTNFFSGNGATGVAIEDAATAWSQAGAVWDYMWGTGLSGLASYRNPGEVHGYGWMTSQSASTRLSQANQLFGHKCARGSELASMLSGLPSNVYQSTAMRNIVLNAPNQTRGEFIALVAQHYRLEPELVGAIILTEQRDQSEAEDLVDFIGAYHRTRQSTSIGLGQVTPITCINNNLLDRLFAPAMFSPWRFGPNFIGRLLADDALNIEATARYIRMIADAGAEVENARTNSLHTSDPRCPNPSSGVYDNLSLESLSVMSQDSSNWTSLADSKLPATIPTQIKNVDGTNAGTPSAHHWSVYYRGQYYVRLIGFEYTSCPFDPAMLRNGITYFRADPSVSGQFTYLKNIADSTGAWGLWVSESFDDCKRSSAI